MLKSFLVVILLGFTYFSMGVVKTESAQSDVLDLLLEGVEEEVSEDLLFSAVGGEDIEYVDYVLERFPEQLEYRESESGATPFLLACYLENMEIMELFLDKKPEVIHDVDNDQDTCLNILILTGAYDGLNQKIKTLIDRGVDLKTPNLSGVTPFLAACSEGNMEIMEYFLDEKEVDVNSANEQDGNTCLHYLAAGKYKDQIRKMINRGADHKKANDSGQLPAHILLQTKSEQSQEEMGELSAFLRTMMESVQ